MQLLDELKRGLIYLDGGMGTYLQAIGLQPGERPELWSITHPQIVAGLHRAYYEAGSHIVLTDTFGANLLKFTGKDGSPSLERIVAAAMECAKAARASAVGGQRNKYIGLDIGPLGRLLKPFGDLDFEEAVSLFSQAVKAGASAGADLVFIETMSDSYEAKAALLAAKESCSLPVFVSVSYDESGKLMTGGTPESVAAMLEGLGADAIGMNCSVGPQKMLELLPRLARVCSVPIIVKPNAGMPRIDDGRTVYDVDAAEFGSVIKTIAEAGAQIIGGCCGTTPEYIRAAAAATAGIFPAPITEKKLTVVSSYASSVEFGGAPVLIGERINPTGKKKLKEALRSGDIGYILGEGLAQADRGADILDVNVGLPELDEPAVLAKCVVELQGVCSLPLQLDTSDPAAMERAMRIYNGKPMVNSVNGKPESMEAVFPLIKKYGGLTVCLTLDESGIPDSAEGRFAIAQRIADKALEYGIGVNDLVFDPLALTIASDPAAARTALDTIELIHTRLGAKCSLGVSNISFGLPSRDIITASFFTIALARGLDAAIVNPFSAEIAKAHAAYMALSGNDADCAEYIKYAQSAAAEPAKATEAKAPAAAAERPSGLTALQDAIVRGLRADSGREASESLLTKRPVDLINDEIIPALDIVGKGYEAKTIFLPQLLMSAEAACSAFEEVKKLLPAGAGSAGKIVLATVRGDIHDIGKNIVKVILENYGYQVIDLGRDVPPEDIAEAVCAQEIRLVGLSALMTTTVPAMRETVRLLREEAPYCRIMVGGAVLTAEYARLMGADRYCANAMESVRYAGEVFDANNRQQQAQTPV